MTQQIPILEAFKRIDFGHGPIPSDQTLAELLRPGCSQDSKLIEMGEGEDWEPSKRESQRVLRHYNNEAVAGLNLKKFGSLAEPFIEILAELYMIASVREGKIVVRLFGGESCHVQICRSNRHMH